MKNILIFGFYFKENLGDNLFIDAFKKLFPKYKFIFTNHISIGSLVGIDTVFIGGGSFLNEEPSIEVDAFPLLKFKNILYIGIGTETNIHPLHKELIIKAKLIATRINSNVEKIKQINSNIIVIPDLVYALTQNINIEKINKSILFLPNVSVLPQYFAPYWKHLSWEYFKLEFSQVLDSLLDSGYKLNILPMCTNKNLNDIWAAHEIVAKMKQRGDIFINTNKFETLPDLLKYFAQHELVITQRYHGMILSELSKTKFISIHHHDKLKSSLLNNGQFISYFECSKQAILNKLNENKKIKRMPNKDLFKELKVRVAKIIEGS